MKLKDYLDTTSTPARVFADLVSVTGPTVWRWLAGTRHPSVAQMRVIFRVTKGAVTPNDLVLE
jgi:DNA-binding transcriptional regulator YdaS (Cro superfamily)